MMVASAWQVLIVDDDASVHEATEFALSDELICERPLEFHHAYSAGQVFEVMKDLDTVAVVLLDVVMERPNAGLEIVEHIRSHPVSQRARIIVRTGQPGLVPEREIMSKYCIDDYCAKSEVSSDRLITILTTAIRTYSHRCNMAQNAAGLEKIIQATPDLKKVHSLRQFGEDILAQFAVLVRGTKSGVFILEKGLLDGPVGSVEASVVAGYGPFAALAGSSLEDLDDGLVKKLNHFLRSRQHQVNGDSIVLVIPIEAQTKILVYLEKDDINQPWGVGARLLEVFAKNIALGFKNLSLVGRLKHLISTDSATCLPTKTSLFEKISSLLDDPDGQVVVASVELAEWDLISSGISPEAGDRALASLAEWTKECLPEGSLVARVGDNRLGIALNDSGHALKKMMAQNGLGIAIPFGLDFGQLPVRLKMGWSRSRPTTKVEQLWREAELALGETKHHCGNDFVEYHDQFARRADQRIKTSRRLSEALRSSTELSIKYQPIRDLQANRWIGAEALCRWQLKDGTEVAPHHFITIAEATGQILTLGSWVLREVCKISAKWVRQFAEPPLLSVNLSVQQLQWPGFIGDVRNILRETGADPSHLEFEITESTQMENSEQIGDVLSKLQQIGCRIALDDFGTGFASLTNLLLLPLDTIKIDCMVTAGIDQNERHLVLAKAIIQLAHDAGLTVTAEGVERESQVEILKKLGCDRVQGYFYAKPGTITEFKEKFRQMPLETARRQQPTEISQWPHSETGSWDLMIIDDDSSVHDAIAYALEGESIFGQPIVLTHEYSAKDAIHQLNDRRLPAVILLDIDMETDSAGFTFLNEINTRSDFYTTQIVFCSGGKDSESHAFLEGYDVYDFYHKNELSQHRVTEILAGALRARNKALKSHQNADELKQNSRQLLMLKARLDERALAEADLRKALAVDALTGISNRAFMEKALQEQWFLMLRAKAKLGFLLIDIDQFKKYNDTYGHIAGDRCLRRVAQTIAECCSRTTDICARYGGEEFAIIVPGSDLDGCKFLAKKILTAVAALKEPNAISPFKNITVSIGIACCVPGIKGDCWDLVQQADIALYKAKSAGRNQFQENLA